MIDTLLSKVFGTKNEREVKAMRPIIAAINALEPQMQQLSDAELAAKTQEFKQRLADGATLDDLMVEAFAVFAKQAGACSTCGISMFSSSAASSCIAAKSPK